MTHPVDQQNHPLPMLKHYRSLVSEQAAILPIQKRAFLYLQQSDLPHKKTEDWHYTSIRHLLEHPFTPAKKEETLTQSHINELILSEPDGIRIVLYNGNFQPQLSHIPQVRLDEGLHIESLREALSRGDQTLVDHLGKLSGEGNHLFNTLNTALIQDGIYIHVAAHSHFEQPIEILHVSLNFSGALISQPRHLLILDEYSSATIVENYASLGDTLCFNNSVSEIFIGENARLNHPRLQDESQKTRHLASLFIQQAESSQYQCTTASLGALWSRTEIYVDLKQTGAQCKIYGLYVTGDNQSNHNHLHVSHTAPNCHSHEFFKGILQGHSRAVFDGLVIVQPDAQQTDAHLSNTNLLLSRDAEIDTKPVLEINADDVKCSHGTTVGQIDQEMLFYLRARGIPEQTALQMICLGFATEIVEHYNWKPLQQRVTTLLQQRFENIENIRSEQHSLKEDENNNV